MWKFRKSQSKKRSAIVTVTVPALSIVPQPLNEALILNHVPGTTPLKNRNADSEADQRSMENDGSPTDPSNVTTAPTHTLSGRDSVTLPDETKSSLTIQSASQEYLKYQLQIIALAPGKRPSGNSGFNKFYELTNCVYSIFRI